MTLNTAIDFYVTYMFDWLKYFVIINM